MSILGFAITLFFIIGMLVFSLLQYKKPVREYFSRIPLPLRIVILAALAVLVFTFGVRATWDAGGFMYANF